MGCWAEAEGTPKLKDGKNVLLPFHAWQGEVARYFEDPRIHQVQSKRVCASLVNCLQVTVRVHLELCSRAVGGRGSAARGSPPVAVSRNCPPAQGPSHPGLARVIQSFFLQVCHVEEQPCGSVMICERVMNKGVECESLALSF